VCAAVTGPESWVEVETFGQMKQGWLKTSLQLLNGIPTHDTFGRLFAGLDAEAFQSGFARWVEGVLREHTDKWWHWTGKPCAEVTTKQLGKMPFIW